MKKSKSDSLRNPIGGRFWSTFLLVMHLMMQRFGEMIGGFPWGLYLPPTFYLIFARNHSPPAEPQHIQQYCTWKTRRQSRHDSMQLTCVHRGTVHPGKHARLYIHLFLGMAHFLSNRHMHPSNRVCLHAPTWADKVDESRTKIALFHKQPALFEFSRMYNIITQWVLALKKCWCTLPSLCFDPRTILRSPSELNPVLEAGQLSVCARRGGLAFLYMSWFMTALINCGRT